MFGNLPLALAAGGSIEIKDVICIPKDPNTGGSF